MRISSKTAQHLAEFTIIGLVILGICLISVFFFSDQIAAVFKNNVAISMFKPGRGDDSKLISQKSALSNIKININGGQYTSGAEAVLAEKLLNGNYTQTSGSAGELIEVIKKYLEQLNTLLSSIPDSLNGVDLTSYKSRLQNAIINVQNTLAEYANYDNTICQGNEQCIAFHTKLNISEIASSLTQNGAAPTEFNNAAQELINQLNDGQEKDLLSIYTQDIINLGESLEYKLDSRLASEYQDQYTAHLTTIRDNTLNFFDTLDSTTKSSIPGLAEKINLLKTNGVAALQSGLSFTDEINSINNLLETTSATMIATTTTGIQGDPEYTTGNNMRMEFINTDGEKIEFGFNGNNKTFKVGNTSISEKDDLENIADAITDFLGLGNYTYFSNNSLSLLSWPKTFYIVDDNSFNTTNNTANENFNIYKVTLSTQFAWPPIYVSGSANYASQVTTVTNPVYNNLQTLKTNLENLNTTLSTTLENYVMNELKQVTDLSIIEKVEKQVNVYRNGNYSEIIPDSYNNKALCESLGGSVSNNTCNYNN